MQKVMEELRNGEFEVLKEAAWAMSNGEFPAPVPPANPNIPLSQAPLDHFGTRFSL